MSKKVKANNSNETKKQKEKTFRISAKRLLLTYPKCPLTPRNAIHQLQNILKDFIVINYLVVRESHQDESFHLHAYIELYRKVDIKTPEFLDIKDDFTEEIFHGNYTAARQKEKCLEYLVKDITNSKWHMLRQDEQSDLIIASKEIMQSIGGFFEVRTLEERMILLSRQGKINEALQLLERENPRRFLSQGASIERRLKEIQLKEAGIKRKFPWRSFNIPNHLSKALNLFKKCLENNEGRVLIIKGKPGSGKTQALISYMEEVLNVNVLVISDTDAIRYYDKNIHGAILLDDIDLSKLSREALLSYLNPLTTDIFVRYGHVRIEGTVPKAITTNVPLHISNGYFDLKDKAIARRVIYVVLNDNETLFFKTDTSKNLTIEEQNKLIKSQELKQECEEFEKEQKQLLEQRRINNITKEEFFNSNHYQYHCCGEYTMKGYVQITPDNPEKIINQEFIDFIEKAGSDNGIAWKDLLWIFDYDKKRQEILYDIYIDEESELRYQPKTIKRKKYSDLMKELNKTYFKERKDINFREIPNVIKNIFNNEN